MNWRVRTSIAMIVFLFLGVRGYANEFRAGFSKVEITPAKPTPMWGYGARHAALSTGVRDPLYAKAVVLDVGTEKLAIVGLDLGRSLREDMLIRIRKAVKEVSGIQFIMIAGSHTHHGPVIELLDEPGKGQRVYDDAVTYAKELEEKVTQVIQAAAANVRPARIGWGTKSVAMNQNRHSKIEPKPVDTELGVIRLDDFEGKTIALIANYAAHPTMLETADLRFSAEWPGAMRNAVEEELQTNCIFMQGASGDLSTKPTPETRGVEAFGRAMATHVVEVAKGIETKTPDRPALQGSEEVFEFATRISFKNPINLIAFSTAFFPELAAASMTDDLRKNGIHPRVTTMLINQELALVGGSGEFFCLHGMRLKERSRATETFFFGYCNGHQMYFPTIEGAAEGGYGADSTVSWVQLGAGEEMMDHALISIYKMLGKFKSDLLFAP